MSRVRNAIQVGVLGLGDCLEVLGGIVEPVHHLVHLVWNEGGLWVYDVVELSVVVQVEVRCQMVINGLPVILGEVWLLELSDVGVWLLWCMRVFVVAENRVVINRPHLCVVWVLVSTLTAQGTCSGRGVPGVWRLILFVNKV